MKQRAMLTGMALSLALGLLPSARWSMAAEHGDRAAPDKVNSIRSDLYRWDLKAARQKLQGLLSRHPGDPAAWHLSAELAFYGHDYREAVEILEGLHAAAPPEVMDPDFYRLAKDTQKVTQGFKNVSRGHFSVFYRDPRDAVLVQDAIEELEKAYQRIGKRLRYYPEEDIRIEIYPDVLGFVRASTLTDEEVKNSGTVALCKFNRIMMLSPRLLLRGFPWGTTLAHEYVHYLLIRRNGNTVPVWMHEGMAKYLERERPFVSPDLQQLLARGLAENALIDLDQMYPSLAKLGSAEKAGLAYAQAYSIVAFISEKWGWRGVDTILRGLERKLPYQSAVQAATGMSFARFERAWRERLRSRNAGAKENLPYLPPVIRSESAVEKPPADSLINGPDNALGYVRLGDMLQERRRFLAASVEYRKAYRAARLKHPVLADKLALALILSGKYDRAVDVLREALTRYPDFADTHYYLGMALQHLSDTEQALHHFKQSFQVNPFNPDLNLALSRAYADLGMHALSRRHAGYWKLLGEARTPHPNAPPEE